MLNELLLEIGTEEIPAGYIPTALKQIEDLARNLLNRERIEFGEISTYGTPRRLVLLIKGVSEYQKELVQEITGPPQKIAFDNQGNLTSSAYGFAKSQGVQVEDIKIKQTEKGAYIYIEKRCDILESKEISSRILPEIIQSISFPKSMRWGKGSTDGNSEIYFARPIRWILAILNKETTSTGLSEVIEFELGCLRSGQFTYGHRFLSNGEIKISSSSEYFDALERARVIVDQEKRRAIISAGIEKYLQHGEFNALGYRGDSISNSWLEDEVVYLVEYPNVIKGSFDESYLNVPADILISAMQEHQRYFPLIKSNLELIPNFLIVANSDAGCNDEVRRGNERVLSARLADAAFFFKEDRKKTLSQWVEDEKGRVFQENLGSLYEKTLRIVELAKRIAQRISPALIEKAQRAAFLCKADLGTEAVGEFPKLQGIMGYHYALLDKEDEDVALAIKEHYLPVDSKGELPESLLGAIVGIADKIDTIVGCFGVGIIPSGSQDPYGLRRQAQGVVDIILKHKIVLSMSELIIWSLVLLEQKVKRNKIDIADKVTELFKQRIRAAGIDEGIKPDEMSAILSVGFDNPREVLDRGFALSSIRQEIEFEALIVAFKRAINIVKKEKYDRDYGELKENLLQESAEKDLYKTYQEIKAGFENLVVNGQWIQALKELIRLKQPIDRFFNEVMVMVEDIEIQKNRLVLLSCIANLFLKIADLSYLKEGFKCSTAGIIEPLNP